MRITEKKKIEVAKDGDQVWGHISLDNLAIPESMRITINGDKIKPTSFDIYGSPNFPKELAIYYDLKEQEIRRNEAKKNYVLKAEISYEQRVFDIPKDKFDSKEGIKKSLTNLHTFTEMLDNRLIFKTKYYDDLNEFIIFGKYKLDAEGHVWLRDSPLDPAVIIPDVLPIKQFEKMIVSSGKPDPNFTISFYIPRAGYVCPCCGRKFTIEDIKTSSFGLLSNKVTHKTCFNKYKEQKEIYFFCSLVDHVYFKPKFEISKQSNGNYYIFHTDDGDIQCSREHDTISITYLNIDNYESCETKSENTAYLYLIKTHQLLQANKSL